jgi:hypothetical protein
MSRLRARDRHIRPNYPSKEACGRSADSNTSPMAIRTVIMASFTTPQRTCAVGDAGHLRRSSARARTNPSASPGNRLIGRIPGRSGVASRHPTDKKRMLGRVVRHMRVVPHYDPGSHPEPRSGSGALLDPGGEFLHLVVGAAAFGHLFADLAVRMHHCGVIAAAEDLADPG